MCVDDFLRLKKGHVRFVLENDSDKIWYFAWDVLWWKNQFCCENSTLVYNSLVCGFKIDYHQLH